MIRKRERHPKLTLHAMEIVRLRDSGMTWTKIAAHYGLTNTSLVRAPYKIAKRELAWRESERKRIAAHIKEPSHSIYHRRAVKDQHRLARIESFDEGALPLPVRKPRAGDFCSPERAERIVAAQARKSRELAEKFEDPADQEELEAQEAAEQARQAEAARIAAMPVVFKDACDRYWNSQGIGIDDGAVSETEGRFYYEGQEVRIMSGTPPALPSQQQSQPKIERPDPVAESLGPKVAAFNAADQVPKLAPPAPQSHHWSEQTDIRHSPMAAPGLGPLPERPEPLRQPVQPYPDPTRKPVMVEPSMEKPAEPTLLEPIDLTPKTAGTQVVFDDDGWLLNFAGQPIPWKWRDGQRVNEITGAALEVRPMPKMKPREPQARIG